MRRRRSGLEVLRASPRCRRDLDIPPSTPQKTGNASVIVENGKWFSHEGKREIVRTLRVVCNKGLVYVASNGRLQIRIVFVNTSIFECPLLLFWHIQNDYNLCMKRRLANVNEQGKSPLISVRISHRTKSKAITSRKAQLGR